MGVQVGAEDDALGTEAPGEVLDEVEVVAEAGVEDDVGRDVGDEEALPRGLEAAERVEREDREVGDLTRDRGQLPQCLLGGVVHRVDDRHQRALAHPL
jgi:hypothetical protein